MKASFDGRLCQEINNFPKGVFHTASGFIFFSFTRISKKFRTLVSFGPLLLVDIKFIDF